MRQHWLKANGHARAPLPAEWLTTGRGLDRTGFPRRPRMAVGDRLVYYASVWRVVYAVVEVTGEPDRLPDAPARWPWSVPVAPLLLIADLGDAPPVEAAGVFARSMSQQSHIRLTPDQYERAVQAIASVAL